MIAGMIEIAVDHDTIVENDIERTITAHTAAAVDVIVMRDVIRGTIMVEITAEDITATTAVATTAAKATTDAIALIAGTATEARATRETTADADPTTGIGTTVVMVGDDATVGTVTTGVAPTKGTATEEMTTEDSDLLEGMTPDRNIVSRNLTMSTGFVPPLAKSAIGNRSHRKTRSRRRHRAGRCRDHRTSPTCQ